LGFFLWQRRRHQQARAQRGAADRGEHRQLPELLRKLDWLAQEAQEPHVLGAVLIQKQMIPDAVRPEPKLAAISGRSQSQAQAQPEDVVI
jgi:hypothetical protein